MSESRERLFRIRSWSKVMTGDDVKKDLENQPRQLQEKKSLAEEKKT